MKRAEPGALAVAVFAAVAVSVGVVFPVTARATGPWVPTPGLRWQFQLQGNVPTRLCTVPYGGGPCVRPDVYEIDLYANDGVTSNSSAVTAIHAAGGHAVCYVDAGTWEAWRPDAGAYPAGCSGCPTAGPGSAGSTSAPRACCSPSSKPG